jgi:capsular exopolysaccharide synthesis family protein
MEEFQIKDLWYKLLSKWYWFALSVVVCLTVAALYLACTPDVYETVTAVLIKDDGKGGAINELSALSEIDLFKSHTDVHNEIEAFRSPDLMQDVVRRLNLEVSYGIRQGLRRRELYSQTPLIVSFLDSVETSVSFTVELLADSLLRLADFADRDGSIDAAPLDAAFGDTITTPAGRICLTPTLFYVPTATAMLYVSRHPVRAVAAALSNNLEVTLTSKETTVIRITYKDVSLPRAIDLLNTMLAVYDENWIRDKNRVATNISHFINERLLVIEKELGGEDDRVQKFKSQHLLPDPQSAATLFMDESRSNEARLFDVQSRLTVARYIRDYLRDNSKRTDMLPANSGINDLKAETQIGEYNTLLLKRNQLLQNSSERSPIIVDINNSLTSMRQSIVRTVENLIVTLELQQTALKGLQERMNEKLASSPEQEKELVSIERQQKIKESLYLYLLQKREENEISSEMTASNTRLLAAPAAGEFPVAPRRKIILLAALILGLAIPYGIIWFWETIDTTVRNKDDLKDVTAPLLGEIPLKTGQVADAEPEVKPLCRDMLNEAFRLTRTNLEFMRNAAPAMKALMFSSFNAGSGKSFIALNTAMSLALTGRKVVLVDLDLRKATMSKRLGVTGQGVSAYLGGQCTDINPLIIHTPFHDGLDMLPAGIIPPNPAELLHGERLPKLINSLRQQYDYVLLDCPPIHLVTDADIIGKHADMVIMAIRVGLLDRRMLPELQEMYTNNTFPALSIILNAVPATATYRYGYGKHGYY